MTPGQEPWRLGTGAVIEPLLTAAEILLLGVGLKRFFSFLMPPSWLEDCLRIVK